MPIEVTASNITDYEINITEKTKISKRGYINLVLNCDNQEKLTLDLFFDKNNDAFNSFKLLQKEVSDE